MKRFYIRQENGELAGPLWGRSPESIADELEGYFRARAQDVWIQNSQGCVGIGGRLGEEIYCRRKVAEMRAEFIGSLEEQRNVA